MAEYPSLDLAEGRQDPQLYHAVAKHYDELIELYGHIWGPHIHHGFWDETTTDPRAAHTRMVQELASFAQLSPDSYLLDAGCGVGGPAFYLARTLGARIEAVTLSQEQVAVGNIRAAEAGLTGAIAFHQQNAVATNFPDNSFDAVWALESVELMPDKSAFFTEALRVLRPAGRIAVATWFVRPGGSEPSDGDLLRRIHDYMPSLAYLLALPDFHQLCEDVGFTEVVSADWTGHVHKTWDLVPELTRRSTADRLRLLNLARQQGDAARRFLDFVPLMQQAYSVGAIRYGVLGATKPAVA